MGDGRLGTVGRPGVVFWGPEDDILYISAQEFHTSTREGGAVKFRGASPWNRLVIGCCYFHIVYGQVAGGHIVVKAAGSATITDIIAVVGPKPEVGHMTQVVVGWGQLMCGEIVGWADCCRLPPQLVIYETDQLLPPLRIVKLIRLSLCYYCRSFHTCYLRVFFSDKWQIIRV